MPAGPSTARPSPPQLWSPAWSAASIRRRRRSLEGVSPTFTYYAGSTVSGSGSATAPTSAGTYTVVATFPGSAHYAVARSSPLTFTINKATPTLGKPWPRTFAWDK